MVSPARVIATQQLVANGQSPWLTMIVGTARGRETCHSSHKGIDRSHD